eukprot:COSAG01_NODE_59645_length_299_cov_0.775000_1_plen_20_part_01
MGGVAHMAEESATLHRFVWT